MWNFLCLQYFLLQKRKFSFDQTWQYCGFHVYLESNDSSVIERSIYHCATTELRFNGMHINIQTYCLWQRIPFENSLLPLLAFNCNPSLAFMVCLKVFLWICKHVLWLSHEIPFSACQLRIIQMPLTLFIIKWNLNSFGFRVMSAARIPLGCDNFSEFLPPCCLSRFASGSLGPHPMCVWKEYQSFSLKVVYPEMLDINLSTIQ